MSALVIFWAFLLVPVLAQTKYCCTPPQWESDNTILQATVTNGSAPVFIMGTEALSVDGNGHKVASMSSLNTGGVLSNFKVIQDFDMGTQYTIIGSTCTKKQIPAWTPKCVPDDAKLLTTTTFGLGDNKLDIDVYGTTVGANTVYLDIAKADCSPVYISAYGSLNGVSGLSVKTHTNFTLGIKDMTVFDVPAICKTATLSDYIHSAEEFVSLY